MNSTYVYKRTLKFSAISELIEFVINTSSQNIQAKPSLFPNTFVENLPIQSN